MTRTLFAALAAAAIALPAAGAHAEGQQAQTSQGAPEAQAPQQAAGYSDAQVETFALAYLDVASIRDRYMPEIEAAESADEQDALRQQATAEMVEAIEQQGMEVGIFNEIAAQSRQDQALNARINAEVQSLK